MSTFSTVSLLEIHSVLKYSNQPLPTATLAEQKCHLSVRIINRHFQNYCFPPTVILNGGALGAL